MKKRLIAIIISICMVLSFGTYLTATNTSASEFLYSTVYSWDPATMPRYNCYAYVLGLTDKFYIPGDFNDNYKYNLNANVYNLAEVIKADLKDGFGYKCIKTHSNCPASLGIWSHVMAMRRETIYDFRSDFHVAKLTSEGWLHKPGSFAILKFNDAPSNDILWTNERFDGEYNSPNVTYDSPVLFMSYKANHGVLSQYTWTEKHYHSGTSHFYLYANICADCDGYENATWVESPCTGPTCNLPWSVNPDPITE